MKTFNVNMTKICAFCKHWFDPSCSALKPKSGYFYEIDDKMKKRCDVYKLDKQAISYCKYFERKL